MGRRYLRFICGSLCAAIAAALLAVVPGAAFAACLSPAGSGGDVWFNKDHAVMQYCNGTNWISMLAPGATIEPSGCDAIGDVCSDGSIYAGLSPDGNAPMFTTPADWGSAPWNNSNITGAVDTALQNCSTGTESACFAGDDNTLFLASADSDNSVGGTQPHLAAKACNDLVALGRNDWYLPSIAELDVLHTNRTSGALSGTFSGAADYWSSSEIDSTQAALFDFSLGVPNSGNKTASDNVRCVRKGDPCRRTTPTPGAVCDDGSIYAGLSPDGNRKMFTTAADAPSQMTWGGEGTDTALENCYGSGSVCTTGAANTALLAGLGAGYAAATYCDQLNEDGHVDWYLPALGELSVVYSNLGPQPDNGFQNGDYWTASEVNDVASYLVSFVTGDEYGHTKNDPFHVRCVRVSSCASPYAPAGAVIYNEDYRVLQWCDGTSWRVAGPISPVGPKAGCVNPAGTGGNLVFNSDYCVMQYCDGDHWQAIGMADPGIPTPAVVQSMWASRANTNALSKALASNVSAGNQVLVFAAVMGSTVPDNGVTDSQGNSYAKLYTGPQISSTRQYLFSTANVAAGPLTITVTPSSTGGDGLVWSAVELSDTDVSAFDISANQNAGSGQVNLSGGVTTQTHEISFAFIDVDTNKSAGIAPPAGWTHEIYKNHGTLSAYGGDAVMSLSYKPVAPIGMVGFDIDFNPPTWAARASLFAFKHQQVGDVCDPCNPDPCVCGTPSPGDQCGDGSYYVGEIGGQKTYSTSAASETSRTWNNGTSNWTTTGFTSTTDGLVNTTGLVALADAGSPYQAAIYCDGLMVHGHDDWYLPARDELNLLWNDGVPLADVQVGSNAWYWTSTEDITSDGAYFQRFTDGSWNGPSYKDTPHLVRCLRR
ncbi:MAG: DUF1566 domain-containing protein [Mesorhizobium sp.]